MIDWLPLQKPDYYLNKNLSKKIIETADGHFVPYSLVDLFDFFKENGAHLERNYRLHGASKKTFSKNITNYKKIRSKYVDCKPRQMFSFDKYRHVVINNESEEDVI